MIARSRSVIRIMGCAVLFFPFVPIYAQEPTCTLRGQVVDATTGGPIPSASLLLSPANPQVGTVTDSTGRFMFTDRPVGYYTLNVQHMGYEELLVPELWLRAGKEVVLRIEMHPIVHTLPAYTVSAMAREELAPLGGRTITVEQGLRYPAMFQDPTRVASTGPGVINISDGANHLTVRGNSPNANAWLLEGAEIVNPNHLSISGTPSDLPNLSGGGVTILSAQMLGNSQFLTGSLPTKCGNALGGITDMSLRRGNAERQEWTAQAGLLGLDIATEGPLGASHRSSYVVNYRYSTVGLLSAMGVQFGDETITFQDLSFHIAFPLGERGDLRLFGLGGTSSNIFEAERDTTEWEFDKDGTDITHSAQTGAAGITLGAPLGGRTRLKVTLAASSTEQEREQVFLDPEDFTEEHVTDLSLDERKLTGVAQVDGAAGARFRYSIGGSAMERSVHNLLDEEITGILVRPFVNGRYDITDQLQASAGVGYAYFTYNSTSAVEPRAALSWRMAKARKISLAAGIRSQLPWHQLIMVEFNDEIPWNEELGLTISQDMVLGYDHPFNDRLSLHAEIYYQQLTNVPMPDPTYTFGGGNDGSMVNVWDEPAFGKLLNNGEARNMGAEITLNRSFANNAFYQANLSVFQSTWENPNDEFDTRWNNNYIVNLLGGKEFKKVKGDRVRTWGVSGRVNVVGGMRESPIDLRLSEDFGMTAYGHPPFSEQLATIYRLDVRVYLKKDRKGRTGMWALDLQNLTGAQNEAYRYYDARKGEVVTKYQLGLIPNLSYRIEF